MAGMPQAPAVTTAQSAWLTPLGFSLPPFGPEPDPAFCYLGGSFRAALDYCQVSHERRAGPILIEGDAGAGKTLLATRLVQVHRLRLLVTPLAVTVEPGGSAWNVYSDLVTRLGAPRRRSADKTLVELRHQFTLRQRAGQGAVIILDDAHHLREESLGALEFLLSLEPSTAQVIVLGQPELLRLLAGRLDLLRRAWRVSLSPLLPLQSRALVDFRCQVAGRSEPLLTDDGYERLYQLSGGNPGRTVSLCAALLPILARARKTVGDAGAVERAARQLAAMDRRPHSRGQSRGKLVLSEAAL